MARPLMSLHNSSSYLAGRLPAAKSQPRTPPTTPRPPRTPSPT